MNPQEKSRLEQFLQGLISAKVLNKLPDADQLIREAVARQPDAAYRLVQRCMLLEQGLMQARTRIAELEQSQAPRSFFEGGDQATSFPRFPSQPAAPYPPPGTAAYGAPSYGVPPPSGAGAGGFLGQAAATAAGVAGGAFLFEGLEHLFSHSQAGLGDGGFGVPGFVPTRDETVTINNFYEGEDTGRAGSIPHDDYVEPADDPASADVPDDDDDGFGDDSTDPDNSWT